jgi:MFS family permease
MGRSGFWTVATIFVVVNAGGTLPIPLYVLWQPRFGFGAGILTVIFAAYALVTMVTLVAISTVSDQLGRKPVLAAAIIISGASAGVFLVANSVILLIIARVLSGVATGLISPSATAALSELESTPSTPRASLTATVANLGGFGLGTLLAGLVAEYYANPTSLVFWIYLGMLVPVLLSVTSVPETVARAKQIDWRPHGLTVPTGTRAVFALVAAATFCAYTLNGLYSSLVPSFLSHSLHEHNHAVAGAVSSMIFIVAALSQLLLYRVSPRIALQSGLVMLLASLALIELAIWDGSLDVFLAGTLAGGIATGVTFMGGLATINLIAQPEHRAQTVSAFFVSAYAGITIPVLAIGIATESIGAKLATLYFAIAIGALALIVLAAIQRTTSLGTRRAIQV